MCCSVSSITESLITVQPSDLWVPFQTRFLAAQLRYNGRHCCSKRPPILQYTDQRQGDGSNGASSSRQTDTDRSRATKRPSSGAAGDTGDAQNTDQHGRAPKRGKKPSTCPGNNGGLLVQYKQNTLPSEFAALGQAYGCAPTVQQPLLPTDPTTRHVLTCRWGSRPLPVVWLSVPCQKHGRLQGPQQQDWVQMLLPACSREAP